MSKYNNSRTAIIVSLFCMGLIIGFFAPLLISDIREHNQSALLTIGALDYSGGLKHDTPLVSSATAEVKSATGGHNVSEH